LFATSSAVEGKSMEFVSLNRKIDEAGKDSLRNVQLFGADNFRSWMLYFQPGDGTPMHYHQSPETFLVINGKCSVKGISGDERVIEKNDIVFLPAKEYYQLTNVGSDPLVLFGNRSEPFGVRPVRAEESSKS
jgi:mannose-6-phosphate isomerase-like protein (cupin superfamily)